MYHGGFFPGGSLGVSTGISSGWGNVDKTPAPQESKIMKVFLSWFPKANKSKFKFSDDEVSWGGKKIFPSGMPRNTSMNNDLGVSPNFPPQLQSSTKQNYAFPKENGGVNSEVAIYHSQGESTVVKFRDVFKNQQIKFKSASECRRWQAGPNWGYWPQQLNLATWCATGGCGVTVDWNAFPPEVRNLLKFHVVFTVRRLLYEMGCALPDDTAFNQLNNPHNKVGIEKVRREFNAPTDFRNKRGGNGGLGDIHAHFSSSGHRTVELNLSHTMWSHSWPQTRFKFRDESGSSNNRVIDYIMNATPNPEGWFMLRESYGLTMVGKGRLNRSIEAFVYCVLGAQVNMRSSIIGQSGSAQEVKEELVNLFEKAIIEEELSVSAQRYQEAIQSSRAKLDFALAPGLWLLPSDLEINLSSKVGYNNFLQKATSQMKLGVNNVNKNPRVPSSGTLRVPSSGSLRVPSSGTLRVPSESSLPATAEKAPTAGATPAMLSAAPPRVAEAHQNTLIAIAIGVAGVAWWLLR